MQETIVKLASYLFLAGIVLVFLSTVPAFRRAWPKAFMVGFLTSVLSLFLVFTVGIALK